jgi:hypothetical protein
MRGKFCLFLTLLGLTVTWAARAQEYPIFVQEQATTKAREKQYAEQYQRLGRERFLYPLANLTQWQQTLWATALLEPQTPHIAEGLAALIQGAMLTDLTPKEAQTVHLGMQVATQLYLSDPEYFRVLGVKLEEIVKESPDPQWSAMALVALSQGGFTPTVTQAGINALKERFVNSSDLSLQVALTDLQARLNPAPLPPLEDLLTWQIAPEQAQLYVFCRPQREVLCRAVLKDSAGNFVEQEGKKWSVLLLSRSLHRLRWHFVRGDTPAGVYRVQGTMPRPESDEFRAFGQFPLLKVFLPLEAGGGDFVQDLSSYRALLPPTWRGYFPLEGSYWAGKLGRSLIRLHGTGENPELFARLRSQWRRDGYNPAIGCLSALELYDQEGRLLRADMPEILQAFRTAAGGDFSGYLVVVEVPSSRSEPVSLEEIEAAF